MQTETLLYNCLMSIVLLGYSTLFRHSHNQEYI